MISKQFLITGIIMGCFGMLMSVLFRLQLAWPDSSFPILETLLGSKWAPGGKLDSSFYMGLVTIHGTIMVFFVLTAGLSGTFSNLLIPLQCGARDMASPFLNMLSYWFFFASSCVLTYSVFIESGPAAAGWTVYQPLSALPKSMPSTGTCSTLTPCQRTSTWRFRDGTTRLPSGAAPSRWSKCGAWMLAFPKNC